MTDRHDRARPRLRSWLATGAAAAACVATPAVAVALVSSHHDTARPATRPGSASATLTCPKAYDLSAPTWVPAEPDGVDGAARLAPLTPPSSVLVCAYVHDNDAASPHDRTTALTGGRTLAGNLDAVSTALGWAPRSIDGAEHPCTLEERFTDPDRYLVGLTYAGATIWVSAPGNHCSGSSNGVFTSDTNFAGEVAAALRTGDWPASRPPTRCYAGRGGRLGQETTLVPGHPTRLTICSTIDGRTTGPIATPPPPGLVDALDALPVQRQLLAGIECSEGNLPTTTTYQLRFGYDTGPDVVVDVLPHCTPAVRNGSLEARDATAVTALIERLTGSG